MEVFGPELIVGGQTAGEVLDIVGLAVPVATAGQEFVYGVVLPDVCTLYIDADVVHPTLAALLHLLDDDAFQLTVGQRLPLSEGQVVGSEFRQLFHHIIAKLVAATEEVLYGPDDALLFVHLRERLAVVGLVVGRAEHLADEVVAQGFEMAVP